jgi:tRNA (guanine-N7-)-methyltransferase
MPQDAQPEPEAAPVARKPFAEVLYERREALRAHLAGILPTKSPLSLELGCGHGHFLTAYAEAHPNKVCIGIDIVGERIERAQRKRDRARLANLHFIRTEGSLFLSTLPSESAIAEIFVLFPDPWPKSRHHKHRLVQASFLSAAARTMSANARMCFRTDHRPYFDEALARVEEHPNWDVSNEAWPFEYNTVFQSRASIYFSWIARKSADTSHKPDGEIARGS